MDLTVGSNLFFWTAEATRKFYADLAQAPVSRVVVGEVVCSKRLPFWEAEIPTALATLQEAGKEVAISTLGLVTLKRERNQTDDIFGMGVPVEINDITALKHLPENTPFWVGPLVNVYNEGTVAYLARRGATRICLPPELPLASIATLAKAGKEAGVKIEVWGHGRLPLAISARCYHARLHDRAKDNCQFICGEDWDGREVDTLDGQAFLSVNGVQTLSAATGCAAYHTEALRDAGVDSLRLSPQTGDFMGLCAAYADRIAGNITPEALVAQLLPEAPGGRFADGFFTGPSGSDWAHPIPA
ncbi:collagenase-like PrtC family protease [Rhodobacter sp. JA431]|uniref:ubiquinone anaerobic biosynthesis protein UbiV n=1 Tax=Rhodobacter sp. JA431 TaxID=570013 RepID=UPI000BCAC24E|nr:U32 family peptidase [Rhodobacter sp. JA431]SOB98432.1 collagenase-like PrtC family protease [Rhodobacter sp. JA431]